LPGKLGFVPSPWLLHFRTDDRLTGQRAVDGTFIRDLAKPFDLSVAEVTIEFDLAFDQVDLGCGIASAMFAILSVNLAGAQAHLNALQEPLFSPGVHLDRHDGASSQGTEQEAVWIGALVVTNIQGLIGDEFVPADLNLNLILG
jgi:hypothetical protein